MILPGIVKLLYFSLTIGILFSFQLEYKRRWEYILRFHYEKTYDETTFRKLPFDIKASNKLKASTKNA
jgi:hypothetical protein